MSSQSPASDRRAAALSAGTRPQSGAAHGRDFREAENAARAAWLHFVGGLTQSEVARRLDVPTTRAHRYIARAQSEGLVRVFVDVDSAVCAELETKLIETYDLTMCRVAMDIPSAEPLPLRALSSVAGDFLMQTVAGGKHSVIGVGNGRTLAASVDAMGRIVARELKFVSMLGGLTRSYAANPYDVIHRLAQKTDAESHLLPAPLFTNSATDKKVMLAQHGIAATIQLIERATLAIVGIGDITAPSPSLPDAETVEALRAQGATAEVLGQFLDADGQQVLSECDKRVMAPPLESLRDRHVVAIAGGLAKVPAIRAVLKSGILNGLIIDEVTARSLVDPADHGIVAAQ